MIIAESAAATLAPPLYLNVGLFAVTWFSSWTFSAVLFFFFSFHFPFQECPCCTSGLIKCCWQTGEVRLFFIQIKTISDFTKLKDSFSESLPNTHFGDFYGNFAFTVEQYQQWNKTLNVKTVSLNQRNAKKCWMLHLPWNLKKRCGDANEC